MVALYLKPNIAADICVCLMIPSKVFCTNFEKERAAKKKKWKSFDSTGLNPLHIRNDFPIYYQISKYICDD